MMSANQLIIQQVLKPNELIDKRLTAGEEMLGRLFLSRRRIKYPAQPPHWRGFG